MTTSAITGGTTAASTVATSGKSVNALNTDDFLKLLVTQLTNQDPFEPVKNQDMLNQIGSIRSLDMNQQLNTTLKGLTLQGSLNSAGGLMGKAVSGVDTTGQSAAGLVTGVRVESGEVLLELDNGRAMNVNKVVETAAGPATDSAALQALTLQGGLNMAAGLIGKVISGVDTGGEAATGKVTSARVESGQVLLDLDNGKTVNVNKVNKVTAPA